MDTFSESLPLVLKSIPNIDLVKLQNTLNSLAASFPLNTNPSADSVWNVQGSISELDMVKLKFYATNISHINKMNNIAMGILVKDTYFSSHINYVFPIINTFYTDKVLPLISYCWGHPLHYTLNIGMFINSKAYYIQNNLFLFIPILVPFISNIIGLISGLLSSTFN